MSKFTEDITKLLTWLNKVRRRQIDILQYLDEGDEFYVVKMGTTKSMWYPIDVMQLIHKATSTKCIFNGGFTHWLYDEPATSINNPDEIKQEAFFPQKMLPKQFTLTPEEMLKLKKAQAEYDYAVRNTDEIVESDRLTPVEMQLDILSEWEMKMPLYKDRLETYISELTTYICRAYSGVNKV